MFLKKYLCAYLPDLGFYCCHKTRLSWVFLVLLLLAVMVVVLTKQRIFSLIPQGVFHSTTLPRCICISRRRKQEGLTGLSPPKINHFIYYLFYLFQHNIFRGSKPDHSIAVGKSFALSGNCKSPSRNEERVSPFF